MTHLYTPKKVARAIQVSESSVKRWCDKGVIRTQYTAGGHRRIPLDGLLEFLRASNYRLESPEILNLPASSGSGQRILDRGTAQLIEAFINGDAQQARSGVP